MNHKRGPYAQPIPPEQKKTQTVTVRVPIPLYNQLVEYSRLTQESLNTIFLHAADRYINETTER